MKLAEPTADQTSFLLSTPLITLVHLDRLTADRSADDAVASALVDRFLRAG